MGRISLTSSTDLEIMAWLGERLAALRDAQDLTSLEAAAQAGLSRRTVYRAEKGQNPTLLTVVRLLRLYGRLESLGAFLAEPEMSPMEFLHERTRTRTRRGRGRRGDA